MDSEVAALLLKVEELTLANSELKRWKLDYNSDKQSFTRMSSRLKKLCKRLEPTTEIVVEMQAIAAEIKQMTLQVK